MPEYLLLRKLVRTIPSQQPTNSLQRRSVHAVARRKSLLLLRQRQLPLPPTTRRSTSLRTSYLKPWMPQQTMRRYQISSSTRTALTKDFQRARCRKEKAVFSHSFRKRSLHITQLPDKTYGKEIRAMAQTSSWYWTFL